MAAGSTRELHSPAASAMLNPIAEPKKPAAGPSHVPLSLIDSWGGLDGADVSAERCGALGRRLATSRSAVPTGLVGQAPEKTPGFRSFKEAHPLRWRAERVTCRITARLWEAPMFVAIDPADRPLAGELADPEAVGLLESAMPERYRLIVPLMRWGGLRWSELAGLRRRFCKAGRIVIVADGDVGSDHGLEARSLRCRASYRLDRGLAEDLDDHLGCFAGRGRNALIFTHDDGACLHLGRFVEEAWTPALEQADLPVELDPVDLNVCWMREQREPE